MFDSNWWEDSGFYLFVAIMGTMIGLCIVVYLLNVVAEAVEKMETEGFLKRFRNKMVKALANFLDGKENKND